MKLGKLETDRNVKLTASIPETVAADLEAYAQCYKQEHGAEVIQSRLVSEMLRKFMQEDSDFQRYLRSVRQPGKPAGAIVPRTPTPTPSTPAADPEPSEAGTPSY